MTPAPGSSARALDLVRTSVRRWSGPKSRIGYIGWTDAENLGDDAMLEAARRLLPTRSIESFRGARREAALACVGLSGQRAFSRIFLGGGTLVNDGYMSVVRRALDFDLPIRTLGTGVGSSGFAATKETPSPAWLDLLTRFERVGVRGPQSLAKLQALGIDTAEIIGDLALALAPDSPLTASNAHTFLLNVAAPKVSDTLFPTEVMFAELTRATKRLMSMGLEPIPVAFCEDDLSPTMRVIAAAGVSATIARPRTAEAFFNLARTARLAVGVRLHCAVLSVCAGVAPLAVAYRSKVEDFSRSVGLEDWTLSPTAGSLAEHAALLADTGPIIGARAHALAVGWREKLRGYVADA